MAKCVNSFIIIIFIIIFSVIAQLDMPEKIVKSTPALHVILIHVILVCALKITVVITLAIVCRATQALSVKLK